jgi:hypothetical protein
MKKKEKKKKKSSKEKKKKTRLNQIKKIHQSGRSSTESEKGKGTTFRVTFR